ncbi:murein biosynthesis integral membrane protein MurJ [Planctomycetaceae bacterium SH139]
MSPSRSHLISTLRTGVVLVASGLLLGRISGLIRELAIADTFGLTRAADLAIFAMTLPDLLTNLLVGGAVAAVIIPQYHSTVHTHGEETARGLIGWTFMLMATVGMFVTLLLLVTSNWWVSLLGPGFQGAEHDAAKTLSCIALLAFPLSVMSAVVTAALQISERLFAAVAGTLIMNSTVICVLLLSQRFSNNVQIAAWAVVAGAMVRLLIGVTYAIRQHPWRDYFPRPPARVFNRSLAPRYLQALGAIGFVVCFAVVARAICTHSPGDSAAINYALKLVEVPAGLVSAVIGFIFLPRLSKAVQAGASAEARRLLRVSLGVIPVTMVVMCGAFTLVADPIVTLLFQRGEIAPQAIAKISLLARIAIWGAPAAVLSSLFTAHAHAHKHTRIPCWCSGIVLLALLGTANLAYSYWNTVGVTVCVMTAYWLLALLLGCHCWWLTQIANESNKATLTGPVAQHVGCADASRSAA